MHARKLWLWAALVGGCGDAGGAAQGQETGPCLDGMCLGALECRSDVCVDPSGGATEPEPTPTTGTTMTGPCEPGTTGCQCIIGGCETGNECVENLCEARVYTTTSLGGNGSHTCVTLGGGEVRCWGSNAYSILGVMTDEYTYGDDELARDTPLVDVGAAALQVDAGARHSCALLEGGAVRCWGDNWFGQLGYGHVDNIGDDETPASQPVVQLGGPAVEVQVGEFHSCALMEDRTVRCWGQHPFTGQGSYDDVGDDEHPSAYPAVDIGGPVEELAVGEDVVVEAKVRLGKLAADDVAVELYHGPTNGGHTLPSGEVVRMKLARDLGDGLFSFEGRVPTIESGAYALAARVMPYNPAMSNPYETSLVRWA